MPCRMVALFGLVLIAAPVFSEGPAPVKEVKTEKKRPNIAVANFDVPKDGGVPESVAVIVSNMIRDALINTGRFVVIDRAAMDVILQEQAFQKSGCTTAECAVEIGKLLNVQIMVVGTVSYLQGEGGKGEYLVSVRAIGVEKGDSLASKEGVASSQTALRGVAKEIAAGLAPIIGGEQQVVAGDSAGFLQDVLTVLGLLGAFIGLGVAGQ